MLDYLKKALPDESEDTHKKIIKYAIRMNNKQQDDNKIQKTEDRGKEILNNLQCIVKAMIG